jgi:hypothetical protein
MSRSYQGIIALGISEKRGLHAWLKSGKRATSPCARAIARAMSALKGKGMRPYQIRDAFARARAAAPECKSRAARFAVKGE